MASKARGLDQRPAGRPNRTPIVAWLLLAASLWVALAMPSIALGMDAQAEVQSTSTFGSEILAAKLPALDSLIRQLQNSPTLASEAGGLSHATSELENRYDDPGQEERVRAMTAMIRAWQKSTGDSAPL